MAVPSGRTIGAVCSRDLFGEASSSAIDTAIGSLVACVTSRRAGMTIAGALRVLKLARLASGALGPGGGVCAPPPRRTVLTFARPVFVLVKARAAVAAPRPVDVLKLPGEAERASHSGRCRADGALH